MQKTLDKNLRVLFQTILSRKNIIIANSTFSWWAAWLGMAEKVVCPPYLINGDENSDIFKPEWTRIDNSINSHEVFI